MSSVLDAGSAEALALLNGLELAEQLGCTKVTLEPDSLELIQACKGELEIFSPYIAILADIFARARMVSEISFAHCPREANRVAHHLAKYAFDSNTDVFWDGDPPSFIMPFVIADVTLLAKK